MSTSRVATLSAAARVGLDRPEDGEGEVFPLSALLPSVFSIALAAMIFAPSDADAGASFFTSSFFGSSFLAAAGVLIERTFAFGAGASPPMLRTLGPPSLVVTGLFSVPAAAEPVDPSVGRLAIVGTLAGGLSCAGAGWGCCA